MKRLTFILACLALLVAGTVGAYRVIEVPEAVARMNPYLAGAGVAAGPVCDSCTSNLIFSAHFENNDDVEEGDPCGCNTNADKTLSKSANMSYSSTQANDGTYSLYCNNCTNTDSATIPVDINKDAGTLDFYVYVTTANQWSSMIFIGIDGSNYIACQFKDTATISCVHRSTATGADPVAATNNELSTGSWHRVVYKWRTTGNPSASIQVDANSAVTTSVNLDAMTGTAGTLQIFSYSTGNSTFFIDSLKVYSSWQD